jgi:hypothetical protein
MALRVFIFGVIVAPPGTDEFIMLRRGAILGDGDGNETGPSIRGVRTVRPVPGVKCVGLDHSGNWIASSTDPMATKPNPRNSLGVVHG